METNDLMDEVFNRRHTTQGMCDSDRNIMFDLAHESCEAHCEDCGQCVPHGVDPITIGEHDYCDDCGMYNAENVDG